MRRQKRCPLCPVALGPWLWVQSGRRVLYPNLVQEMVTRLGSLGDCHVLVGAVRYVAMIDANVVGAVGDGHGIVA